MKKMFLFLSLFAFATSFLIAQPCNPCPRGQNCLAYNLTTNTAWGITQTSAYSGSNAFCDGYPALTQVGLCYNTTGNPTISDSKAIYCSSSCNTNAFSVQMTGLSPLTTYYVRSYATNATGTAYGTQMSFTTLPCPQWITTGGYITLTSSYVTVNVPKDITAQFSGSSIGVSVSAADAYEYHVGPNTGTFTWTPSSGNPTWDNLTLYTIPTGYTGAYITQQLTLSKSGCPNDVKTAKIFVNQ